MDESDVVDDKNTMFPDREQIVNHPLRTDRPIAPIKSPGTAERAIPGTATRKSIEAQGSRVPKNMSTMSQQVAGRPCAVQILDELWRRSFTVSRHAARQSRDRVGVMLERRKQSDHDALAFSFDDTINGPVAVFEQFVSHE